jgi:hypothetical protein
MQILGRLIRLYGEKLGYFIGFKNVVQETILPLLKKHKMAFPLSEDYLLENYTQIKTLFNIEPLNSYNNKLPESIDSREPNMIDENELLKILNKSYLGVPNDFLTKNQAKYMLTQYFNEEINLSDKIIKENDINCFELARVYNEDQNVISFCNNKKKR